MSEKGIKLSSIKYFIYQKESVIMFFGGVVAILIIIAISSILNPDKMFKQMPVVKIIVYAGVAILTLCDFCYGSENSKEGLATAVTISAIFEIVTNFQETIAIKKKSSSKKTYIVTVEEIKD